MGPLVTAALRDLTEMKIGNVNIGLDYDPVIIAEMSGNHNQSLQRALDIVDSAVNAGVQLLKLQTYTPDTITLNCNSSEFVISNSKSLWSGRTLYDLYSEAYTPWEWQEEIISYAHKKGIECFSSVFDESSVDFLESLGIKGYKLASQEIVHLPLIKKIAATGKPLIMSTGMATLSEIDEAVCTALNSGAKEIAIMKCTSTYPASVKDSNVLSIPILRKIFNIEVGLSDHTLGIGAALGAIAHGATFIEKHLTLDRNDGGVDSAFSLEPKEFEKLVSESKNLKMSLGSVSFGPSKDEIPSLSGRRSIFVSKDIKKGEKFSDNNLKIVRPNNGLHPKYFEHIIGLHAKENIKFGTPLKWDDII